MQLPLPRFFACITPLLVGASAQAEIDYHLSILPTDNKLAVEITVPASAGPVSIQIPNWMPGAYSYGDFYRSVNDVTAVDSRGKSLNVTHPDNNTWTVNASADGSVKFSYWMPTNSSRRFMGQSDGSYIQVSGPATYMYVLGRKTENCKLTVDVPSGWPIEINLANDGDAANRFVANSYDTMADAPISTGQLIIQHYNLRGKDHDVVLMGAAKDKVDVPKLVKDCRFVSAAETDFWGSQPYNKYVWHFTVFEAPDGAGGLEHLGATQIGLSSGEGQGAQSVLSHEFFHLWNVKRSRAEVLGPFDYLHLPKTGNLWWLEGVTDYYAWMLPYRYGEWDRSVFYKGIVRNMDAVRTNPARLKISAYQASYRVGDAAGGRGNSNGFEISYYNLGWLCGMCLDLEIRSQTHNHRSLDDVARALYNYSKNGKPGWPEDEIRKQCVRIGGPELGPFFDKVVMTPGELPIEQQLAKVGLMIHEEDQPFVDVGFTARSFGGNTIIFELHGPADGKLTQGDEVVSINGKNLASMSNRERAAALTDLTTKAAIGTPVTLTIKRDDKNMDVSIDPVQSSRKVHNVENDPAASADAIAFREKWLATKTPSVP
jgi:predicted metalloprotease with PDZ domain